MAKNHTYENNKVTFIIGCYNHSPYVKDALDSIKNQNYPAIQLIIFDDASTDNSQMVIDEWISMNTNIEIEFIKQKNNIGRFKNLNHAIKKIKGKYLIFFSADDMLFPEVLFSCVEKMERLGPQYAMLYGDTAMIDCNNRTITQSMFKLFGIDEQLLEVTEIFNQLSNRFYFYIQSTLIRTECFKLLHYNHHSKIISEDWDVQLHLAKRFKSTATPQLISKYRYLENSITRTLELTNRRNELLSSQLYMFLYHYQDNKILKLETTVVFEKISKLCIELIILSKKTLLAKLKMFFLICKSLNLKDSLRLLNRFVRI